MQSLTQEIQSFSRTRLRKQCTRVTSLSGRRIIETWKGSTITVVEDPVPPERMLGYVPDTSWDLQVGTVKPYLLLGSQDAAHDFGTLRKHKVSHILNVAFGVENAFPDLFLYKTVSILDHPDTDLLPHIQDCSDFIQQARKEKGVVLVHCNAGVSRAPAVVIGFLMSCEGQSFDAALSLVRSARPASSPNPGFLEQLRSFKTLTINGSKH
ncbi:dual specificity protein phosphatase 19a [Micropterus dolomieu]|uniref:dual specificity protein phosphatase 19a n=1 Tax=Micropterus dolomieu TaxID=147949 RepID=UPI001E8E813E|nr:dual specificity protein phosphatase 19a [Micropterus dolomieu]XP_045910708.1 dual specificity protein phosphatase 19a [Micropterus dolomieu]XP_045910709.1 dual specificity protein phosphatase 19a [Micropterus dolomieu]XP_045910710.1 dual specificity protein phosphatase 19a [Micropterus dolomieu]XP_045910711.1 dual specificity protein phosphatase 19a [Micropterus dolomieu]XP_045910712.1 dual specificity protein phosphatase 19a [Micropterus dolomieu]